MKCLVLYAYPVESDGQSLQGDLLRQGIIKAGDEAIPCHFKDSFQKRFYLEHWKPDVVFGIGYWGNVPDVVREPFKYNVMPVPWFNADGWVANYKKEFDQLKLMFTTSDWVRQVYKRDGFDISKIVPQHIGIDTNLYTPSSDSESSKFIRSKLGIKDHEKMILTAGGDVTSKGAQEMFRALKELDKEFKDWKYVCKAWPSECAHEWRGKEQALIDELELDEKVVFIDDEFTPEFMKHLINACDVYAGPSRLEGFGMIQVEAMSCGKPVISINKMGPSETIIHNKTGFLADVQDEIKLDGEWIYPHMGFQEKKFIQFESPKTFAYRANIDQLKDYTLKLLTDDQLRKTMGLAAREHTVKNLDYTVTSKRMVDVTKEKLGID